MLVHVLSAYPEPPQNPENIAAAWLKESALLDPFGKHRLCNDPDSADLVLFTEGHPGDDPFFLKVLSHPIRRKYAHKSLLYHDGDLAIPLMKGIFPSIRSRDYDPLCCRSGWYIARIEQPSIPPPRAGGLQPKYLYTFMGENNSPSRARLFSMPHPRGLVEDTTGRRLWSLPTSEEKAEFHRRFSEAILDSRFSLCPAGVGTGSYRFFESMEMGVAPVIISDQWVPFEGPPWESFSIRIAENQMHNLEGILHERACDSATMGRKARQVWEEWFSKPVAFHRMIEHCRVLLGQGIGIMPFIRSWIMLARPENAITLVRPLAKKYFYQR
jgi:hypothetical protein